MFNSFFIDDILYQSCLIDIKFNANKRIPKKGDKINLIDYSLIPSNEAIKLSKMPYLEIDDICPVPMGENGNYEWHWSIYIKGCEWMVDYNDIKFI